MAKEITIDPPNTEETVRFITGLCGRRDLPLSAFFRQYWLDDQHVNRLPFLLRRLAPLLHAEATLLDVGSFGEWPLLLWRYFGMQKLSACSLEGGYLGFGGGVLKAPQEEGKEFELVIRQINIENEPLPDLDQSLDIITFFEVLEHLRVDPVFVMKEFNRTLRPGGLLILSTPNVGSYDGLLRMLTLDTPNIFSQYFPDRRGIGHAKEYAIKEVRQLCDNCGFSVESMETFDYHPSIGLDPSTLHKFQPLKDHLGQYGWSEEWGKQTMLVVARRTGEVKYRYYQPLYTVTEPAINGHWLGKDVSAGRC